VLRVGAGLWLGKAVAGDQFAGGDLGQVFLLLFFRAEIDDGDRPDASVAAVRHRKRSVAGEFFGQHGARNLVQARAAVGFGDAAAQQAQLAGLANQ